MHIHLRRFHFALLLLLTWLTLGCAQDLSQVRIESLPPGAVEDREEFQAPPTEMKEAKVSTLSLSEEVPPPQEVPPEPTPQETPPHEPLPQEPSMAEPASEPGPSGAESGSREPPLQEKSDQEQLDSALEFCQASNDFWEQGDLENALDALDQAYSLILKVNPDGDATILQQREDLRFTIAKRIIEIYSSRFTVANGKGQVIPLVMNQHVKRAIAQFQGRERRFFLSAYKRSGRYRPMILEALREAGLPEELSWLPLIESGYKVRALSRARALGLWQFIASTGYKFGLKRDLWVDERMDPEKSTAAAIAYLKELHQIFGDWTTALAAYNCGEGTVLRSIRSQRINYLDNFWDLYAKLPMETAFYVPKFLAVLHIVSDPAAYGFELPPVEAPVFADHVTVHKQMHLKTVARHLGVPYERLLKLNPELRRHATPERQHVLKVPPGTGSRLLAALPKIPHWRPPVPSYAVHRVRKGESLSVIARRYRTSVRAIMALNGLRSSRFIRTGWKLKIPVGRRRVVAAAPKTPPPAPPKRGSSPVRYVVRKGDSLWKIARHFNTTTQEIQSLNRLKGSRLQIGQVLRIPRGSSAVSEVKTKQYKVMKGDSPYVIARKHRMSLSEFLRINRLTPRSTIYPGQTLLVRAD